MKKMTKLTKILSLFMAVLMVLSCMFVASAASGIGQVKSLSAYNIDDDEINLRWSAVKGARGYQIYQYSSSQKAYVKIGVTDRTSYEVEDLKSAKAYKFKVRAYNKSGGKYYYGDFSKVLPTATEPDEVENVRVAEKTKNSLTIKWNSVPRAEGYQVFVYNTAKNKYVRETTVKSGTSVKLTGLKTGTTYKIKIKAFHKYDGKYYFAEPSDVLSAKTSGTTTSSAPSSSGEYIGTAKATDIALKHAGLTKNKVQALQCHLDRENRIDVYEVEFEYKNYEYEYEINALTGKIITVEKDRDD